MLLGVIHSNLAYFLEGEEEVSEYRNAHDDLTKALNLPGEKEDVDTYYHLGRIKSELAHLDNNLTSLNKISLYREAIEHLKIGIKLEEDYSVNTYPPFYYWLGLTLFRLASYLDLEEKIDRYRESIGYLEKAVDLKEDVEYSHFHLAAAQFALLNLAPLDSELSNSTKRQMLKEEIVANFRKSYNLNKDRETLEIIKEIEMLQI